MKNSDYDKKIFYSKTEIASTYDEFRYGGKSGDYINQRELNTVALMLPESGKILDIPCGTGRLLKYIGNQYEKFGVDYSEKMLEQVNDEKIKLIRQDAFNLDLPCSSFDVVISLRFIFHYSDISFFFKTINKILKPGGVFICQNYKWSPLSFDIPVPFKVGGKIHIHSDKKIIYLFESNGFKILDKKTIFLFSPFIYRHLPLAIVKFLDYIERLVPDKIKLDNYWKVIKLTEIQ
ncbi:MAG: hypothetical protein ACD_79C00289G0005 [uncultured bacterium]|nr:MAG: hypothetical protein ACD_79C00289G0005 [uncultured bacterium]